MRRPRAADAPSARQTRTATGLRVRAHLVRKTYKTGVKVTDAQMQELRITPEEAADFVLLAVEL